NYKNLKIMLVYDGEKQVISGTEDELILEYLGKEIENWIHISSIDKIESCNVKIGWSDTPPITPKVLSTVNLIRVHEGAHVNKIYNILKSVISKYAKKHKYNFQPEDCLSYIRLYINLKIIETSFEAQVKVKLGESSNLKIMDSIEKKLDDHFKNNPQFTKKVLEKFESYRKSLESKKAGINKSTKKKRGSTSFTKLKDCTGTNGELIIGEGDSAIGGLVSVRDIKKHALLPLMGVIPNAVTKKNLLQNAEIKDIILALGCGIDKQFDIEKLRYSKIIIAADADPAGHWITALLIILFAKMTPQLIKEGKLYVCKTPLFGYGYGKNFIPLWDDDEVKKARDEGKEIRRFKGLGEFDSTELKRFIMDEKTRELEQVTWSENVNALFRLMSSSEKRRELVNGTWSLDNG
ncbi:MAG: toprim domain-containing protein, partial [Candidatus Woesearchaeota archaeon]